MKNKSETNSLPDDIIEFNGEKYQWEKKKFKLPGDTKNYTREDALLDQGILRKLLSIEGQSILRKLH